MKFLIIILLFLPGVAGACALELPVESEIGSYDVIYMAKLTDINSKSLGAGTVANFDAKVEVVKTYKGVSPKQSKLNFSMCGQLPQENENVLVFLKGPEKIVLLSSVGKHYVQFLNVLNH